MSAAEVQFALAIIGIVGSAVAAFVGSWFGLRRFRSERWWERKVEAYTAIFNAMNNLLEEIHHLWNAELYGTKLPDDPEESLRKAVSTAWPEIRKQVRLGAFLLSEEAEKTLADLLKKLEAASIC
jgi:hypothetical protein